MEFDNLMFNLLHPNLNNISSKVLSQNQVTINVTL